MATQTFLNVENTGVGCTKAEYSAIHWIAIIFNLRKIGRWSV